MVHVVRFKRVAHFHSAFGAFAILCFSYATELAHNLRELSKFIVAPVQPVTNFSSTDRGKKGCKMRP